MRAIKFRAWVRNQLMINIVNIDFNNECITWDDNQYDKCVPPNKCYEIEIFDDIVLMQFTGLSDKNGSRIFEGDIVTFKRSIGNWTGQYMTTTHKIVFNEEVFAFIMEYGSQYIKLRKHWKYEYEVIGNVHENPKLLIEK